MRGSRNIVRALGGTRGEPRHVPQFWPMEGRVRAGNANRPADPRRNGNRQDPLQRLRLDLQSTELRLRTTEGLVRRRLPGVRMMLRSLVTALARRTVPRSDATMKALSVSQPWASLLHIGRSRFEVRAWKPPVLGRYVTHASVSTAQDLHNLHAPPLSERAGTCRPQRGRRLDLKGNSRGRRAP